MIEIKGIEIPISCICCKLSYNSMSHGLRCMPLNFLDVDDCGFNRHPNCPLIEIEDKEK